MNNKGQFAQLGLVCLIALIFFMCGMIVMNILKDSVTDARTGLSCSSPATISDGTKMLCLIVDSTIPIWILTVISVAGGLVISKFII